jgi:hypothetical protein
MNDAVSEDRIRVLARYSRWKAALLAAFLLCLAIVINLPHFGEDVTWTAYFYTRSGSLVRVGSSIALAAIGIVLAFQALRSNLSTRAVWIADGRLHWLDYRERSASISTVRSARFDRLQGLVRIERDGGPDIQIAAVLLRSKADVDALLSLDRKRTL